MLTTFKVTQDFKVEDVKHKNIKNLQQIKIDDM